MASAFDDLFGGSNNGSQQTSGGSAFDDLFNNEEYSYSSPTQDSNNDTPNELNNIVNSESEADSTSAFDDLFKKQETTQPAYSAEQAAVQANGGQSYLDTAVGNVTGQQPKPGLFEKPEIKTTPEREALIEQLKQTPYDSSEYAGYATDEMSAAQIQDFSKRNEILDRLRAIDQELGNGEMDYTALDRAGSVFSNANYQIASGLTNAAGTVTRGVGEAINSITNGEKGQKVMDVGTAMQNMSDNMSAAAQQDVERAKNGLSRFGQAGVDIATNVIQMGFDAAVGAATGGGSLASMFLRSAGNSMQTARNEGASTAQQLLYGGVSGGIEVLTEKIADGVAGIYGKGAADDITEALIRKLSGSEFGRSALRLISGAVSEGGEEVISDLLAPYAELIYNGKGFGETLRGTFNGTYDPSEILYDFVIGATIGALGGGTSVMTGQNANANAQLREADAIQNNLINNNGLSEADARKAADIMAKVERGETITKKQAAFLDSVQEANGIDTTKAQAPQTETQTPQTAEQPTEISAPTTEAPITPQAEEAQPIENEVPEVPDTPTRTVEDIQTELDPILAEVQEIDDAIASVTEGMNSDLKGVGNLAEAKAIRERYQPALDKLNQDKADAQQRAKALQDEQSAIKSAQNKAVNDRRWENRTAKGAAKAPNPQPDTHIDNRTMESVGKSNVNAFQYDNPEVKPHFKRAAEILMRDLGYMQSSMRSEKGNGTVFGVSNRFLENVRNYFGSTSAAIEACEQIIYDKGRENFADPKRIELFLDQMLSDGYETLDPSLPPIQASADYMNLKGRLQGGTAFDPRARAIRTEIDSDFTGETTEEEAARIVDERKARTGYYDDATRDGQEDASRNEGRRSFEEIDAEDTASMEEKYGRTSSSDSGSTNTQGKSQESSKGSSGELNSESGKDSGEERKGPWIPNVKDTGPSKQKVSQTSTNSERNTAKMNGVYQEDLMYDTKSEYESLTNAMARVDADKVGEIERLSQKEMWTGEDGDVAHLIFSQLADQFSENPNDPDIKKAYEEFGKMLQEHKTKNAQALQASAKWARTGVSALLDINDEIDASEDLTAEEKETLKKDVAKFMTDYDKIRENDADAAEKYRKLILEQNDYRRTGTFGNKRFEKILDKETDVKWLKEYARRQALNIPADYTQKPSLGQKLKTWQVCAQLSRVGTFFRNLFGNLSFGGIDTFAQDAFGYAIDNWVSKKTGKKEVGFDKGWLSKDARNSAVKAFERSILEVAGDVDMTGEANRYGQGNNRTNKMVGNEVQRAMSRWEQLLGYSLTSSDRFFRGQIEQSVYDALMKDNPNMTEEEARQIAKETADYRLFQNQGKAADFSKKVHDALNAISIGAENGQGGFGLGDLLNPYPGVPANLAVKALEYSPANIVKGGYELFKLLKDVETGKSVSGQQMTAVMDIARGMSGVPIIALFTALAKSGLFKNSDDDDYDVAAEESAQNLSGVQLNLSAVLRRFEGEKAEWKDGDTIMKVSWLEPLNAFMGIASMLAESDEDLDLESMSSTFFEGAIQAALDMPVMENIQNAINTFKYSQGDTMWQKVGEAGAQLAGDALSGMIPAPISQTARVTDNYVRDTKGDTKAETAYNAFLNSIPGLRNDLPVKTDNFGNARENEPNLYNRFMNSFVRPGAISTYRETDVQDEIGKLYKETGDVALYPDRNGPKKIKVDGIDYPLTADEAREYHQFVGQKSEEFVQSLVDNKAYKTLTTEQKANAVKEMHSLAEGLAKDAYISANGIKTDTVSDATKLLSGIDKAGTSNDKTPLNDSNLANYVVYSEAFKSALKDNNFKEVDKMAKWYNGMDLNLKTVLNERNTDLKRILEYQKIGLGSETYTKIKNTIPDAQNELDANSSTGSLVRLYGVAKADIPEKDRLKVLEQLVQGDSGFIGANAKAAVSTLKTYGLSVEQTAQFFDIALHCATYKDTGDAKDFKGKLTPENTAYALSQIPNMTDAQRSAAYNTIRSQVSNYYNDWGTYTYASEVKWFTNPKNKAVYGTNVKISPQGQNALLKSAS